MKAPDYKIRKLEEVPLAHQGPSPKWRDLLRALAAAGEGACAEMSAPLSKGEQSALRMAARTMGLKLSILSTIDGQRSVLSIRERFPVQQRSVEE